MGEPRKIVDVARWNCYICGASGLLNSLRPETDASVDKRVDETHAEAQPECTNKHADWRFVDEIILKDSDV